MELRLTGFTKRFGATTVIEGMDLTVQSGEMMALLGPSGCGKSTTLFAICGIHRMDGGQPAFWRPRGHDLPAQERPVGVVFQNYALYPHMTVAENIAFPLKVKKLARAPRSSARSARWPRWCRSPTFWTADRRSFRAGSSSAWRWRGRWCANPMCSCSMNRWPISTPSCGWRCGRKSGASSMRPGSPPFWSPMIRSRPCRCATASRL